MSHHHVDSDFDGMGYAYANDNGSTVDKETRGCIELWCAVIEDGFRYGMSEVSRWVRSAGFDLICELAGVQSSVLKSVARKMERKEITVRPRQGMYERKKKR